MRRSGLSFEERFSLGTVGKWGAVTPADVVTATEVVADEDVTFSFNKAVPVGQFVNGDWWALSTEAFTITGITPASGDLQADGRIGNGAVKDPFRDQNDTPRQGFDEYIAEGSGGTVVSYTTYNSALNVDPGATASAISISQGEETSIVKSVRNGTISASTWQAIEKYVTLHILASAPAADAFPPAPSATTKTIKRANQIDWSVFRSLTMPGSFPTLSAIEALVPSSTGIYGDFDQGGEFLRRFRLDNALGTTTSNYSTHIAPGYARACMVMHDDRYSQAEKTDLLYKIITFGMQIDACYTRSGNNVEFLENGAGQGFAWLPFWVYTAFALQDSAMLARSQAAECQLDNVYWTGQTRIDSTTPVGDSGNLPQGWFQEMLGVPLISSTGNQSNFDSRYGPIATYGVAWEMLAIELLRNGPSSETGVTWRLGGSADGTTNAKAAALSFVDRLRSLDPWPGGAPYNIGTEWYALYDLWDALAVRTAWTGVPDQAHLMTNTGYYGKPGDFFTGGDGAISWNYSAKGEYSTQAITDRAVRYSLDGRQWVEAAGKSDTGSISSLLKGVDHYCGYRLENASGWGPWSQNYPKWAKPVGATTNAAGYAIGVSTVTLASAGTGAITAGDWFRFAGDDTVYTLTAGDTNVANGGTITFTPNLVAAIPTSATAITVLDRNVVRTTGTASNTAPVNTVAPVLMERLLPAWSQDPGNWSALAGEVLTVSGKKYACGVGYWTGFPAPTFTYQWKLGGVDVGGQTAATYTGTTNGDVLTCVLTATNSTDSVVITVGASETPWSVSSAGSAAATGSTNSGFSVVTKEFSLTAGDTVETIGVYSVTAATCYVKIVQRDSASQYDVLVSEALTHAGGGWQDLTLSVPYELAGSGSFYLACNSSVAIDRATNGPRAYRSGGNVAVGNNVTGWTEDSGAHHVMRAAGTRPA